MTMNKPKHVTFTGIDERTDVRRMCELSKHFDHRVEWGILISKKNTGHGNRYPPMATAAMFKHLRARFAVHICGRFAEAIAVEGQIDVSLLAELRRLPFDRLQVNVRDGETLVDKPQFQIIDNLSTLASALAPNGVIMQWSGASLPRTAPGYISLLFDCSGGAGLRPGAWPAAPRNARPLAIGYAGGIGPDTIRDDLEAIAAAAGSVAYWIDMENNVRTDDWLDLDKCERVLEAVYG